MFGCQKTKVEDSEREEYDGREKKPGCRFPPVYTGPVLTESYFQLLIASKSFGTMKMDEPK